jgi:hypothetical protein
VAWEGKVRLGKAIRGYAREGVSRQRKAWLGKARRFYARKVVARQGQA